MFITDNIDLEQTENYILTIRISPDFFSFYIEDLLNDKDHSYGEKKWVKDADILTEVQQIIFENNFLALSFFRTNVILVSKNYELIPKYLLEKDKIKVLYNFTHSVKSDRVLQVPFNIGNNCTLFDADNAIYTFLIRSLYNPIFYHHIPLVLRHIEDSIKPVNMGSRVVINCHDSFIDIFGYDKSNILKYNQTLHNEKDIDNLYYIMNFWTKLNLNQETDFLYIITDSSKLINPNPLLNDLKRYIRNIETINFNSISENSVLRDNDKLPSLDLITIKKIICE